MKDTLILANLALGFRFSCQPASAVCVVNARSVNEMIAIGLSLLARHAAN
jgi:hypothetical protein